MDAESDFYDIYFSKQKELSDRFEAIPMPTSDIEIEVSAEKSNGGALLDYQDWAIYLDPSITMADENYVGEILGHGVKHLKWHPGYGREFRTSKFGQRIFYGTDNVSDFTFELKGKEVKLAEEEAFRQIYRSAVAEFKNIFDTEFRAPELATGQVIETKINLEESMAAGYEINVETDRIVIDEEIAGSLHPDLLYEDFRYMLKRYHDLSAERTVRETVIPYLQSLTPYSELSVRDVIFSNLDSAVGAYALDLREQTTVNRAENPHHQAMKLDYSLLPEFDPVTGNFSQNVEGLPGGSVILHEGVHDMDFTVNEESVNFFNQVSSLDTSDPRNAVLEAPTTFEVYMAGWNVRPEPIQAFNSPLENRSFFEDYPIQELEPAESDSIAYPYNLGLITSLSIHQAQMNRHGLEEGTRVTRDILYGNDWDLEALTIAFERSFEKLDKPNVPRHRREVTEIVEEGEEAAIKEAERLLEEMAEPKVSQVYRAEQLAKEYIEREETGRRPDPIDQLDLEMTMATHEFEEFSRE